MEEAKGFENLDKLTLDTYTKNSRRFTYVNKQYI